MFSKTTNNAINIITIIASFGVIVGTLALFVILSGFSGLRTFSYSLLDASDPDIKITATKGKSFITSATLEKQIKSIENIISITKVIEERVFLEYKNKTEIAFIKGVEENFTNVTKVDSSLSVGTWLHKDFANTAVLGRGISNKLSLGAFNYGEPLKIMVPKPGKGFSNLRTPFSTIKTQIVGIYTGTEEFENKFVFTKLPQVKQLLKYKTNEITAIEIKVKDVTTTSKTAKLLQNNIGKTYKVQTKQQLNEVFYKVINTENIVSYLIFTLIVIIALFNVIGAIIMMIIDKKQNLKTLYSIGAPVKSIKQIFIYQGFLLVLVGMCIGLTLGALLVFLQKKFELFMIVPNFAYPVAFKWFNFLIVCLTILILGFVAAKVASSRITKQFIEQK